MKIIKSKSEALKYLYGYIPKGKEYIFPAGLGLKRTIYLLKQLGEPQNKLKVIHIAGTSGKGSTSFFISTILGCLGFKVGLSVSPHLLDIRERIQLNNQLISQNEFIKYLNEISQAVEKTSKTKYGVPTYFEILVSLAYYIFHKKGVDYAVMETGLGGMFDGTNVVKRPDKIAVITKIGHDHTGILGKTLDKIAFQKAGIIKHGNIVITPKQHPKVLEVLAKATLIQKSKLYLVDRKNIKNLSLVPAPSFDFGYLNESINNIKLRMLGSFQVQNCSLALATIIIVSQKDGFYVDIERIRKSLANCLFLGRMQKIEIKGQTLIIDGAHNPQKMSMFIRNLIRYYPNQKFMFLIAFKRSKDYRDILRYVVPFADMIIVTSFFNQTKSQGMVTIAEDVNVIAQTLKDLNYDNFVLCEDNKKALAKLLVDKQIVKVITGSLYLLSDVYPILNEVKLTSLKRKMHTSKQVILEVRQ